jgi:biphenyl-2,3-diol 1,2-dioxygenase
MARSGDVALVSIRDSGCHRNAMPRSPSMNHITSPDLPSLRLGYLVIEARKPQRWAEFCTRMLGLPEAVHNADGSSGWQIDAANQRLMITEGPADDLAALGLECADDDVLDRLLVRAQGQGLAPMVADAALHDARRVARLHRLTDPAGNAVELFTGLAPAARAFVSTAFPRGFETGAHGMGHAALIAHDLAAMERFYVGALGFGVSGRLATRVGPIDVRGSFLHCNPRHHSLALFALPLRKRLHHFMLQSPEWHDVGMAFERAKTLKVPLSLDLGQHPDPDGTFSFYGVTPSGFDFEIGAGSRTIDPVGWSPLDADVTSSWGHRPQLRLKLKMAASFIASKLGRAPAVRGATQPAARPSASRAG